QFAGPFAGKPAEAFGCRRARLVFAAAETVVTGSVQRFEYEGIVDLPGARLVAARIVGKLDMGDPVPVFLERADQFSLCPLLVVEIILDEQIVAADLLDDRGRLVHRIEVEARNVETVDRFDQQPYAVPAQLV